MSEIACIVLTISTISEGGGENQRIILREKTCFLTLTPVEKWSPAHAFSNKPYFLLFLLVHLTLQIPCKIARMAENYYKTNNIYSTRKTNRDFRVL